MKIDRTLGHSYCKITIQNRNYFLKTPQWVENCIQVSIRMLSNILFSSLLNLLTILHATVVKRAALSLLGTLWRDPDEWHVPDRLLTVFPFSCLSRLSFNFPDTNSDNSNVIMVS